MYVTMLVVCCSVYFDVTCACVRGTALRRYGTVPRYVYVLYGKPLAHAYAVYGTVYLALRMGYVRPAG